MDVHKNPGAAGEWPSPLSVAQVAALIAERDKLAEFKAFVHKRLDDAGVPTDPPGEHRDAGCRIGQRLDVLFARENVYVQRAAEATLELDEMRKRLRKILDEYGG